MRAALYITLTTLAVGIMAFGLYWPGLHGTFFFDDMPNIVEMREVHLKDLSIDSLLSVIAGEYIGPTGRPIARLSFALNYYAAGLQPFVFKATNLVIHLANAIMVFALSVRLLASERPSARQSHVLIAAGVLASVWLLHPIQLLPVLHVVQRMTSLSAFFLLSAFLFHISGREKGHRTGAFFLLLAWGVLFPLSFLSKETGALFPCFVLAWELIIRRHSKGALDHFSRNFVVLAGLILLAGLIYLLSSKWQWLWTGYELRNFSLAERLLTEGRVLWFYLGLIGLPRLEEFGLYHDDITVSIDLFTPWTTLPALFGLAAIAWITWRIRDSAPLICFGIMWFLIGHMMESTVLPLEIAHEHRNYLPLFGVLLASAAYFMRMLAYTGPRKTAAITLTVALLAYLSFVTALRADQFGDEALRTQIEAQHHRRSARSQHEAGRILAELPESALPNSPIYGLARAHYEMAGDLDPNIKMSWLGLIHLNCRARIPVEEKWVLELGNRLRNTPFAPGDRTVLYSLKEMSIDGSICLRRQDVDEIFDDALANPRVSPGIQAMLHSWRADYLWLHERDIEAARDAMQKSLALNPINPSNRLKWAQLLLISGEREQALRLLVSLRDQRFSAEEQNTLNELLATFDGAGH